MYFPANLKILENYGPSCRDLNHRFGGDSEKRLFGCRRQEGKGGEEAEGVAGTSALLMEEQISDQPISGFHWNAEKLGLFCCVALDQCLRVGMITNMHLL